MSERPMTIPILLALGTLLLAAAIVCPVFRVVWIIGTTVGYGLCAYAWWWMRTWRHPGRIDRIAAGTWEP